MEAGRRRGSHSAFREASATIGRPGALHESSSQRKGRGGLGASAPRVSRWLGDIREFFPTPTVQIIQKDALERLNLKSLMLEPEFLSTLEATYTL